MPKQTKELYIGVIIFIFAILIGVAHGYYVSTNVNPYKSYFSGDSLCNGVYITDNLKVDNLDTSIMINNKIVVNRGSISFSLYNPRGELVFFREDDKPIFRQHSIRIDDEKDFGLWKFDFECDKADILYEFSIEVKELN